jgi:hypothetical protein
MYPFFLLLIALAPWKPEYYATLNEIHVIVEQYPCDYAAWTGPDRAIHLCPAPGDYWPWLGLHESQHIMAGMFLPPLSKDGWDEFGRVAIAALTDGQYPAGPYTPAQLADAEYILTYGGHELHAELPWIVRGDIPANLQAWYPWFDLSGTPRCEPVAVAKKSLGAWHVVEVREVAEARLCRAWS